MGHRRNFAGNLTLKKPSFSSLGGFNPIRQLIILLNMPWIKTRPCQQNWTSFSYRFINLISKLSLLLHGENVKLKQLVIIGS